MSLFPELDEWEEKQKKPSLFPELDEEEKKPKSLFPELDEEPDSVGVRHNQNSPRLLGETPPPSIPPPSAPYMDSVADGGEEEVKPGILDYVKKVAKENLPLPVQGAIDLVKKTKEQADETSPEIEAKRAGRQELAETLAPTVDPVSKLLLRTEPGQRMASAMASGGLGLAKNTAAFVPAAEQFVMKKQGIASQYGQKAADALGKIAAEYMPEDPNYLDKLAGASASIAAFAPLGVGAAQAAVSLTANIPRIGVLMTKLAPAIGSTVAALAESSLESGGVYDDMIKKGTTPDVASKAAFSDWWQNVLLTGVTNRLGLFGDKYKGVKKALAAAPVEFLQESYQNVIASLSKGELPDWKEVLEEGVIGGVLGAGVGPLIDISPSENVPRGTVVSGESLGSQTDSYFKTNFPQLRDSLENQNVPLNQEELRSLLGESAAAGEEVLLKGGTPEQADQAAQEIFARRAKPAFDQAQAEAFAEEVKADKKAERPSIEESLKAFSDEFDSETKQTRGKLAAEAVLRSNKIDDRVVVDLVDEILVDEAAFKAGYGKDAKPEDYKFLGETRMSPNAKERIQAVIQLAKGSDEAAGRHEAFHAVSNILLDKSEQDVITKKFGDMEKAADAFGQFRKNQTSTGSSVIDAIFEKFKMFLERLGNYFDSGTFKTADDLFNAIEEGKLAGRVGEPVGGPQYSAVMRVTTPRGTEARIHKNPSAKEVQNLLSKSKESIRYFWGPDNNLYMWDAYDLTHQQAIKEAGYDWSREFEENGAGIIIKSRHNGDLKAFLKARFPGQTQYSATLNRSPLEDKAIQKFGVTNDLGRAGFVLSGGEMIDFGGNVATRQAEHRDVAKIFEGPVSESGTDELYQFMKETGAVRMRNYKVPGGTHFTIESLGPISRDQLRQISEYLETNPVKDATFDVVDIGGFSLRDESVDNPTGEDVARFFNGSSQYSAKPLEGFNDGLFEQTKWDRVKQEIYDRFNPIKYKTGKAIQPEMKQAGGLYTRAYVMARELNGKIRGISESLLKELNERIKPLRNAEDRQILNKIYSLRNLADLDRIGKTTSGIKVEDVKNQLDQLKTTMGVERYDRISKVADSLADIQNNKALNILVDGRVITPKVAETLRERYPNYLRSEIMDEALATTDPQFKRADNGEPLGRINKSFLKTKQGTKMQINDDVLDVIRRSLVTKVAAAQKQLVIDQIAEDFGKEVGRQTFEEGSLVTKVNPNEIPPGYVKSTAKASGRRVFAVRQDVADLLEGLNQKQADFITKAMSSYNRLFRAGATTLRVPFLFNNVFRDVQESLFKARSIEGQRSQIASYVKGAFHSLKNTLGIPDQVYKNWIEAGGAYGGIVSSIPKTIDVPYRLKSPLEKAKVAAQGAVTLPFEAIAKLAEFSENTSRLAEWIRLEGAPLHPELRALQSRDVTVDFEKVGDAMKRINQVVPFLNANVQGTVNDLRAFRDQPALSMGRMMAYIILPAILGYEWNKKFDNEEDVDPYIKNSFWHFNTGMEVEQDGKKLPVLITIRKGAFAQTVSYYVNALLEYANKDPNFKQKLKDFTVQGELDSLIASVVPPIMRLPIEEAANRNFFTGRPIVTQSIENVDPSKQFKPATTNTMRRLGELTGLSPARMEHIATGAFPASQQILEASDAMLQPEPEIKRKDTRAFPLQSIFPMVRTPSGFFNQTEEKAKDFEKKSKTDMRTKNFLFEQSFRQYMQNKTPENYALMSDYMRQVDGGTRTRVFKKIAEEQRMKRLPPKQRGLLSVAKKRRAQFLRENAE